MAIVKPFKGIRPPKELVEQVESRPYDVLTQKKRVPRLATTRRVCITSSSPRLTSP